MQHILGLVRRCVEDYHMIDAGDTVAVGVSGGKDSLLTLTALAQLRCFYPQLSLDVIKRKVHLIGFLASAFGSVALGIPYRFGHEIGRASCRERV